MKHTSSIEVKWTYIGGKLYTALWIHFRDQLEPTSTHTCMEGCELHNEKRLETEWSLKDSDTPLLRAVTTGDQHMYYLATGHECHGDHF